MIVYQAAAEFFPMKADAEAHAKSKGLKASTVNKLVVNDRDDLSYILNRVAAILNMPLQETADHQIEATPYHSDEEEWIPAFVRADWQRRQQMRRK